MKKEEYIKKTFELEVNLLQKFKIHAVCNNKKQRELIKEIMESYFKDKLTLIPNSKKS